MVFHLNGEHPETGNKTHHLLGGLFYEAEIGWDAIISYELLQEQKIAVLPNRHCLMLDQGDHFLMLRGGKSWDLGRDVDDDLSTWKTNALHIQQYASKTPSAAPKPRDECHVHRDDKSSHRNGDRSQHVHDNHFGRSKTNTKFGQWRTSDYAVSGDMVQQIVNKFNAGTPQVDCFATSQNRRFPQFWEIEKMPGINIGYQTIMDCCG